MQVHSAVIMIMTLITITLHKVMPTHCIVALTKIYINVCLSGDQLSLLLGLFYYNPNALFGDFLANKKNLYVFMYSPYNM